MSRAFTYARVSGQQQAESGLGIEAQIESAARYAASHGLEIVEVFTDAAITGTTPIHERPAMMEALATIGKGDTLIVAKRDRIGRDPILVAMIEAAIVRKGGKIVSAGGEANGDSPTDVLMKRIVDAFSEYELAMIKARTIAGLKAKKARGERVGAIPFGYTVDSSDPTVSRKTGSPAKLVIDPVEQEAINLIKGLKSEGYTMRAIVKELNDRGVPSAGGKRWHLASLHRVLKAA